jgi:hypothetical protein
MPAGPFPREPPGVNQRAGAAAFAGSSRSRLQVVAYLLAVVLAAADVRIYQADERLTGGTSTGVYSACRQARRGPAGPAALLTATRQRSNNLARAR